VPIWLWIWVYLMGLNAAAFVAFGWDKGRAIRGERRIREKDLLFLALVGGTGGAYLGRWYYRHKTRKLEFSVQLHIVAVLQIAALGWYVIGA
jgi:uncharacterized membrane protein YsdA (DUF1294 family)